MRALAFVLASLLLINCQKSDDKTPTKTDTPALAVGSNGKLPQRPHAQQIPPPMDLKNPPADAIKTASGLIYKKLVTNDAGQAPKRNDTVMINYTGWNQSTGETFFTNSARGQPMPLNLSSTAQGFTEGMQLLKKGEKAMLWVPPAIGTKGPAKPNAETLVYEVEIADIVPAPEIPADVAAPPATAQTSKLGTKFVVLKPGDGKDKPASYDTVTYNYTAWESDTHMFDTTEMKKRPSKMQPFKQPAVMEEMLTSMTTGERRRFWSTADKISPSGKATPGGPQGGVCYEVEIASIEKGVAPPPVPADVAKPPGDAKKDAKGVLYKVLTAGKGGPKPKPTETVKVNYTGWTTDGRMFDSSVIRKEPAEFSLQGVIPGWTDGLQLMSIGDKYRFWIPEELAYKGQPGRPQGMLVFDIELLEIKAPPSPDHPPGHPPMPHHH